MRCPKCGAENPEGAQLCQQCSLVFAGTEAEAAGPAKTSGVAIASLVLGILSFFTCLLTALPAVICGIIGLVKISSSKGRLKGTGLAIAGIAVPVALIPLVALAMAILMPALGRTKAIAQRIVCSTNMKGLSLAIHVYANDYDDKFPTGDKWCDLLMEEADVGPQSFKCPGVYEGDCHYAMNENVFKEGAKDEYDLVLLFETEGGWNQVGGRELLSLENHVGQGCKVAFVDGHIEFVRTEDIDDLKWDVTPYE